MYRVIRHEDADDGEKKPVEYRKRYDLTGSTAPTPGNTSAKKISPKPNPPTTSSPQVSRETDWYGVDVAIYLVLPPLPITQYQ